MRQEFGGPLAQRVLGVRRAGVRRGIDRPGPSRRHRRRRRGGREGAVPRGRRGGRDRPAQRDAAAAAGQAARARAGRQGARLGDARADQRGARLRARGPEPAPDRATDAGASVHLRAARPHRALDPAGARLRVRRGRALRGGAPSRRAASATATARSSSGSTSACSIATGSRSAIPTRATTCCPDGRVCFLDFGLLRDIDPPAWTRRRRSRSRSASGTRPR